MNPFANLLDQAGSNLGDLSRRAVDSVMLPVQIKSQAVMNDITASVTATVKTLVIKAVLGLFAGVMAIIALAYALSALHGYLSRVTGPIEATLIMAGVFALLAVIAVVALLVWPKSGKPATTAIEQAKQDAAAVAARTRQQAEAARTRLEGATRVAVDAAGDPSSDMRSGIGAIASALGEAGFRKEQAGLRAGLALAEQLKPMQLVSLALIGGFVAGARMARRR